MAKRYQPVKSSWVAGVKQERVGSKRYGYDVLRVKLKDGKAYEYLGDKRDLKFMLAAESKGRFHNTFLRSKLTRRLY